MSKLGTRDFIKSGALAAAVGVVGSESLPARARVRAAVGAKGTRALAMTLGGFMPWEWVTPQKGMRVARIVNDAAIAIPVADPEGSLEELNRVAGKPGLVAVEARNSLAGREYLFAPEFAPVVARIEELRLPLMLHPLDGKANWYDGERLADQFSGSNPAWLHNSKSPGAMFPGLTNSMGDPCTCQPRSAT